MMSRAERYMLARLATATGAAAAAFGRGVKILLAEHLLAQCAATIEAGRARQWLRDIRGMYVGPRRE